MLNKFKEYNDPKIFRNLKIGFLSLIVLGVLLFAIGLAVSPDLREKIGIGGGTAVTREAPHSQPNKNQSNHGTQKNKAQDRHKHQSEGSHRSHRKDHDDQSNVNEGIRNPGDSESVTEPSPGSPGGNGTIPTVPSSQNPPPASHPAENNSPPAQGSNETGSGGSPNPSPNGPGRGQVGVEVTVPNITNTPPVEEVTQGVNETVNGATGTVEETVNDVTGGVGIEVNVPKVCLIHCP